MCSFLSGVISLIHTRERQFGTFIFHVEGSKIDIFEGNIFASIDFLQSEVKEENKSVEMFLAFDVAH